MAKPTIGVFFGSRNPEHEISIITAQFILHELRKIGYITVPVYIDKQGRWYADEVLGKLKFFTEGRFEEKLQSIPQCVVDIDASQEKIILKTKKTFSKEMVIDIAFPAFHGQNGEDGTVQGLFELANVPYIGCGVTSSAMAMDKIITKQLYQSAGIPTTPFAVVISTDWNAHKEAVLEKIGKLQWPVFVKPARLGSSIGIAKARTPEELVNAVEVALHYDDRVIVEESIESLMDVTCAVMGNDAPEVSLVQESVFTGEHFSYESKYIDEGGAQLGNAQNNIVIPARLSGERTKELQDYSKQIFKLFGCSGIARVDFLYDTKNDKLYANEINTLPGTLYHHLWKASGIDMAELLKRLLSFAKERHQNKKLLTTVFASDVLRFAGSVKLQMKQ
ncbi:MAG: D-alanine--D-alanine ligase family protein [Candidatus Moraniibacteriota bacterium]